MKKISIMLIAVFSILAAISQNSIPFKDGILMYERIDSFEVDKNQLFSLSKQWFVDNFKNANHVIQNEDSQAGVISGKISFDAPLGSSSCFSTATISLEFKNSKSRLRIYDINYKMHGYREERSANITIQDQKNNGIDYNNVWKGFNSLVVSFINSYHEYINKKIKDSF